MPYFLPRNTVTALVESFPILVILRLVTALPHKAGSFLDYARRNRPRLRPAAAATRQSLFTHAAMRQ